MARSKASTLLPQPTISSISPKAGPGGTLVTIIGANFTSDSKVKFGDMDADNVTVVCDTQIKANAPVGGTGRVNVRVTTAGGTSKEALTAEYTFRDAPTVTSVNPSMGPTGGHTTVTIGGTDFNATPAVMFGTSAATNVFPSSTICLTAESPPGGGSVHVTVTTDVGPSATSGADMFTYQDPPTINAGGVDPAAGRTAGGDAVAINGTNLLGATEVKFGNNAAAIQLGGTDQKIDVLSPAAAAPGTVPVSVTTPGGTVAQANAYTYQDPPTINAGGVDPAAGRTAGGDAVAINGTNLSGATEVKFGNNAAAIQLGGTDQKIDVLTPQGNAPGTVPVSVTTPGGTVAQANAYTYQDPPTINAGGVDPAAGRSAGGDAVAINGTNLSGATEVKFGNNAAAIQLGGTDQKINVLTPQGNAPGTVPVSVTTPGGTVAQANAYTYQDPPTINAGGVDPAAGRSAGGDAVAINGTNLSGATEVKFGNNAAAIQLGGTDQKINVLSPAAAAPGTVPVSVTTPGGTVAQANAYTYQDPPTINAGGVDPAAGRSAGGDAVAINGTNLSGATEVKFGNNAAAIQLGGTDQKIDVLTPQGNAPGTVPVSVTTPGGTVAQANAYTYQDPPTINAGGVDPAPGRSAGGDAVAINGTNLSGATEVKFGNNAAAIQLGGTDQKINVLSPAAAAPGTVPVSVTTPGGTVAQANAYTYQDPPTINAGGVDPAAGRSAGGDAVAINGTNLSGATEVKFGNNAAAIQLGGTDQKIDVLTPQGNAPGTVPVSVTTPGGTVAQANAYTYQDPPTINAGGVDPAAGRSAGGDAVAINGTNLSGATEVKFGNNAAAIQLGGTDQKINVLTPAAAAPGTVPVSVTTPGGTVAQANAYTYQDPPTINAGGVDPAAGRSAGGDAVAINGTNLSGATEVKFGNNAAAIQLGGTDQKINVLSPAAAAPGTVPVSVTTPGGTVAQANAYTYQDPPTINAGGVDPAAGRSAGGDAVAINGTNLSGATEVKFGNNAAAIQLGGTDQKINVLTPQGDAPGTVPVSVTTPGGTVAQANAYIYVD